MSNKIKKVSQDEAKIAVKTGVFKSYDIKWLKKLRADGEPHPTADKLIEEYDELLSKYVPEREKLSVESPENGEEVEK